MKGLIVKSNIAGEKEIIKVAISEGIVSVMINIIRDKGAYSYWNVGGLKMPEEMHVSWQGGDLYPGDEIHIELADIEQSESPKYQESHKSLKERMTTMKQEDNDSEKWQRKLERYYRLKAILENENLIEKEV